MLSCVTGSGRGALVLGARRNKLTLCVVAGALGVASIAGEGRFAALVTSLRFDPV